MLASPVLGPLAREAVRRLEPGSRPEDVVPPIATLPGLGRLRIPSPVPIPNFSRLYFRCVKCQCTPLVCVRAVRNRTQGPTAAKCTGVGHCRELGLLSGSVADMADQLRHRTDSGTCEKACCHLRLLIDLGVGACTVLPSAALR